VAREVVEVRAAGHPTWLHRRHLPWLRRLQDEQRVQTHERLPATPAAVYLIAGYDPYLLGYRNRDLVVAPEHARRIHPGGGTLQPALLIDGVARGTWRMRRRGAGLDVTVQPFDDLPPEVYRAIEREAVDVGRFVGRRATLHLQGAPAASAVVQRLAGR
jgi:hypothetical protein